MPVTRFRQAALPLGIASALATAMVAGAGFSASADARQGADKSPEQAQKALAKGDAAKAVTLAEALVAGNPREPSYRALLANAYLKAGRFESAATTFDDAMKLGDNSAKTALGFALAEAAAGRGHEAVAILDDWRDAIPAGDLGLALALSGETSRGITILADALRKGDSTPKLRQNLAYAYALDGRWREARIMLALDVPADRIDARISSWAEMARPEDARLRIATILSAPMRIDPGQPAALALVDSTPAEQLAAETGAAKPAGMADAKAELPAVNAQQPENPATLANYSPVVAPAPALALAPAAVPAPVAAPAPAMAPAEPKQDFAAAFAATPVAQPMAAPASAPAVPAKPAHVAFRASRHGTVVHNSVAQGGTHLVQLGSFLSEQGARRAWGIYAARNPELKKHRMTITAAVVRGRNFWRVAAAGFNANGATGLCSTVKARGGACFAYSASRSLPGTSSVPAMAYAKPKQAGGGVVLASRR